MPTRTSRRLFRARKESPGVRRWIVRFFVVLAVVVAGGLIVVVILARDTGPRKPDPIPLGDYSYATSLAEQRLDRLMSRRHIPGAAAALIVDQQVVWQTALGLADISEVRPVTNQTVFKMWSVAKLFTAFEVMRLVEEGILDLDEPLETYVPDYRIGSRFGEGEPVTVRHLLAHHSGWPRNTCVDESEWHLGPDGAGLMAATLADCSLAYPTGTRYKYSNAAYDMLGYLVQAKRTEIFPPYMVEDFLQPIGMANSAFWSTDLPSAVSGEMATGYEYFEGDYYPLEQYDIAGIPHGNLYSTIDDLTSFVQFVFRDGEAGGSQVIRPETLAAMTVDQYRRPEDPQKMGLGWKLSDAISGELVIWHDGGPTEGVGSLIAVIPERKLGVVLMGNSTSFEGAVVMPLAIELLEAMLETEFGIRPVEETPYDVIPVDQAVLAGYAGDYVAFGQVMKVKASGSRLKGSIDGTSFDLLPVAENRFRVDHWLYRLGLENLFRLPVDLRALEIEFRSGFEPDGDVMIINLGGISHEIAPRYAPLPGGPEAWELLVGGYNRYPRLSDQTIGNDVLGTSEILMVDGILVMSSPIGPVRPIDDETMVILGGAFAGETIRHDRETGSLFHQGYVYRPSVDS